MTHKPDDDAALVEQFARAMFEEWPLNAISPALAELSGQPVGSPLTYDKVLEMGGNHDGLLRLAKGAARLHRARLQQQDGMRELRGRLLGARNTLCTAVASASGSRATLHVTRAKQILAVLDQALADTAPRDAVTEAMIEKRLAQ